MKLLTALKDEGKKKFILATYDVAADLWNSALYAGKLVSIVLLLKSDIVRLQNQCLSNLLLACLEIGALDVGTGVLEDDLADSVAFS